MPDISLIASLLTIIVLLIQLGYIGAKFEKLTDDVAQLRTDIREVRSELRDLVIEIRSSNNQLQHQIDELKRHTA